ncbi:MAG: flavodoxin-dependent (E)-4-hydroxy-3-methylbut-2-enyl-diphosphate synthase [Deltaproteobacteria bacterium]|nr:flavodoxin-dependent (E)-4-hydroxy-3-methylbut-2-enyl-diphosphate synthase [Deltaproteobacteria bacterium]MBN2687148.1 flavodoxin-dependent (E)-4-hydroxy-3-methylbut-2-enyl-diphosphate synthase [Deltaproteobacteria bacterium]
MESEVSGLSDDSGAVKRKRTRPVYVGSVKIGGDAPVIVQSMTCTDTRDVVSTVDQITKLAEAGCEVVRVAVPDKEAAAAVSEIKSRICIPLIADIHFNYGLALQSIRNGADCIRINPGNIGRERMPEIIQVAREHDVSMRIGVNAGSLEKDLLEKYGGPTAQALVESALRSIEYCEDRGFTNFKLSLKSSTVSTMIDACRAVSEKTDYPLHLGVTEAGTLVNSAIKSSIGIGTLLYDGIGDTIRVSITGDPVSEVSVAYGILRTLDIRKVGPDIISCPTCGRCEIDLFKLSEEVERRLAGMKEYCKVAIMGCVVNGPGEAAEADVGIAGGRHQGLLFRRGEVVRKIREEEFVDALIAEINAFISE